MRERHPDYQFLDEEQKKEVRDVAGGEGQRVGRGMFGIDAFRAIWGKNKAARKRAKELARRRVSKN